MTSVASPPAVVVQRGDDLVVTPARGSLPEMKTLGARWRSGSWVLAASQMNLVALREMIPDARAPERVDGLLALDAVKPVEHPTLFPYQRQVVARLVEAPRGQVVVLSPGLGKTATAIVAADIVAPGDQVVVVSPASVMRTWQREVKRWAKDPSTALVHGKMTDKAWEAVRQARWLVTTWDTVARHQDWFAGRWPLWVLDESVLAKSRRSTRSMGLRGGTRHKRDDEGRVVETRRWENLRKGIDRVWLLSGSPTTRHADDLWAQLNLLWPRAFPSYWRFAERYCVVEETVWARKVVATRRDRDVMADNADLVVVVSQEDVLDLPEYLFEPVEVDLTRRQRRAFDQMLAEFVVDLDSGERLLSPSQIGQLTTLQRITSWWEGDSAKHDFVVEAIRDGRYEPPFLLWTHWRDGASDLAGRLDAAGLRVAHAHGDMSEPDRDLAIQGYVDGRYEALVLSLGVGKFGLTLTNTKTVFSVDRTWNEDDFYQSLRRVRRIGLGHRPVYVSIRAAGTTDDLVDANLEGKIESVARITSSRLSELLRGLGRPV